MLGVMNDTAADEARRDRMAIAAAPFVHARVDASGGKKAERQANAERAVAQGGKFAPPAPPKLIVSNK